MRPIEWFQNILSVLFLNIIGLGVIIIDDTLSVMEAMPILMISSVIVLIYMTAIDFIFYLYDKSKK